MMQADIFFVGRVMLVGGQYFAKAILISLFAMVVQDLLHYMVLAT